MRINFAGSLVKPNPIVLIFDADGTFDKAAYVSAGYKIFDVICIGGGGGRGGNYNGEDFNTPGNVLKSFGGRGGGGGFHRVKGVLSALPSSADVVVGVAGTNGTDLLTDSGVEYDIATTDGGDGSVSYFNNALDPTCSASGGKGGKRVYSATLDVDPNCSGGDGGSGDSLTAGGGGVGSVAGTQTDPPVEAGVGTLIGNVGKGGGGGAGGVGIVSVPTWRIQATKGEKGAYSPSDQTVFDAGGPVGLDTTLPIVPGYAGGARVTPLNGTTRSYGRSEMNGVVVIRLTVD